MLMDIRPVYRKQDSFVGVRGLPAHVDPSARLEALLARLDALPLSPDDRVIVRKACVQALGRDLSAPRFALQPLVLAELAQIPDDALSRYLKSRYRYEIYPITRHLDAYPPLLQIEPTSRCNYRCVFCYQANESFRKRSDGHMGLMNLDLFRTIVDQAQGHIEAVTLASRGEPLMASNIVEMLQYISGKFLALKVNTNAWYLDEVKAHALLQADVSTLVFSVDAATEPTYSRLRVHGQLARVRQNIERFQDIRAKQYQGSRTITRISGVKVPGTPSLDELESAWGGLVDQVVFVEHNPWENAYDAMAHDMETPCSDLWRRMFVWWDGRANPCDVDYRSTLSVGNALKHSLSELWRSATYDGLRHRHLMGRRPACEPCNRCMLV